MALQTKKVKVGRFRPKLKALRRFNHPVILAFLAGFAVFGAFVIYYTFAGGGIQVFNDNVDYWRPRIAQCESHGNYKATNGTHFGAYQFDLGTWRANLPPDLAAQYPDPLQAPPNIQDLAFNNAFAKRGTQPWDASYYCWIQGAEPHPIKYTPTPNSYNTTITGHVYIDNLPAAGVTIQTCEDNPTTKTDASGGFSVIIPVGHVFCVRTGPEIPADVTLEKTKNNPERADFVSYESQLAGINAYHNVAYFLGQYFTADRNTDGTYDFFYHHPVTP